MFLGFDGGERREAKLEIKLKDNEALIRPSPHLVLCDYAKKR